MTAINVSSGNKNYISVDGVLFKKNKTELIKYPAKKAGSRYTIPGGVITICDDAFGNCGALTSVSLPNGLISIGNSAFGNCEALTNLSIPNGVTTVGDNAFFNCRLTSISFPSSVTSIGDDALAWTPVASVTIYNPQCDIAAGDIFNTTFTLGTPGITVIYGYPGSTAEAYADSWGDFFTFKTI